MTKQDLIRKGKDLFYKAQLHEKKATDYWLLLAELAVKECVPSVNGKDKNKYSYANFAKDIGCSASLLFQYIKKYKVSYANLKVNGKKVMVTNLSKKEKAALNKAGATFKRNSDKKEIMDFVEKQLTLSKENKQVFDFNNRLSSFRKTLKSLSYKGIKPSLLKETVGLCEKIINDIKVGSSDFEKQNRWVTLLNHPLYEINLSKKGIRKKGTNKVSTPDGGGLVYIRENNGNLRRFSFKKLALEQVQ